MGSHTICLITGGNQGIGFEIAKQLFHTQANWHIILGSRQFEKGKTAVADILASSTPLTRSDNELLPIDLDVTSDTSITAVVSYISSRYGKLDVLINNAGISQFAAANLSTSREKSAHILDTNTFGASALTEACIPLLSAAKLPRVVFVSSEMGSIANALDEDVYSKELTWMCMQYKVSKAALNMVAACFARKFGGEGWKVNVHCPGLRRWVVLCNSS